MKRTRRGAWLAAFPVVGLLVAAAAFALQRGYVSTLTPEHAEMGGTAFAMIVTAPLLTLASALGAIGLALFAAWLWSGRLRLRSGVKMVLAALNVALAVVVGPFVVFVVRVFAEILLRRTG